MRLLLTERNFSFRSWNRCSHLNRNSTKSELSGIAGMYGGKHCTHNNLNRIELPV